MSFLSGIFLAAIPLIAIPIALHFYKRRQRDVIPWGAMQFLTDAAIEGRRFERLEELLLMLLRVLAVAALVLAMAQPMVQGNLIGTSTEQDIILILDDSMSMGRVIDDVSSFDRMQERVQDLVGDLSDKNSVQIMLAAGGGRWLTSGPATVTGQTKSELLAAVENLRVTHGAADIFACLQWVIDSEPTNEARARRVVVFTDNQAYGWNTDADGPWQRLQEGCQSILIDGQPSVPTSIQVVDCGVDESQIDNLALVRLDCTRTLTGSDEEVTFSAEMKNVGHRKSRTAKLEWLVRDDQIAEFVVPELKAGESIQRTWSYAFQEEGIYSVSCRVSSSDQLTLDDEQTVVIEVVDKIPFLIVEEPSDGDSNFAAARLLTATLGYENDVPRGDWQSVFTPRIITYERLNDEALAEHRAVVITDMTRLSTELVDRLRSFVERGGGLWVGLGNRTERDAFNANWFDDGDGLSPLKLAGPIGHGRAADAEFEIHPPTADHIVTKHIADTQRLDIDEVKISRHHQFVLEEDDTDISVLLETGVGAPIVIENYVGDGRVIVQAVPLGMQWSNMPLTKAYVVMVHDFLAYLTQPAATRFNLQPGGEIAYAATDDLVDAKGKLETSQGDTITLTPHDEEDSPIYRFADTYIPGRYQLKFTHGNTVLKELPFYISRDVEESNLERLTEEQRDWLMQYGGLDFVEKVNTDSAPDAELPSAKPVWWMLLVLLLFVMIFELALASQSARRRYAPAD